MEAKTKISLMVFSFLFCLYYGCSDDFEDVGESIHKIYTIDFGIDTVYVKASMWGLTGDHIQIVLSPYPYESKNFDSSLCLTYFEPTIYYKKNGDTLVLYSTTETDTPTSFNHNIHLKQIIINKLNDINRFKEKYREYGLERISVY